MISSRLRPPGCKCPRRAVFSFRRFARPAPLDPIYRSEPFAMRGTKVIRRLPCADYNDYLRDYWQGRMPLGWELVGPYPIRVDGVRVRLDVATPSDVEKAADQLAAELAKTFQSGLAAVSALRYLAGKARENGLETVARIGDLPPHKSDERAS